MPKRVLVVDDHSPTRTLIRSILESDRTEGFQVVEAASGEGCLRAVVQDGPFDVVLLDVTLPDMDGFTVCRNLRATNETVPVVFVTARADVKDYAAGREVGGDSYLVKPIARASLRSVVSLFARVDRTSRGVPADGPAEDASVVDGLPAGAVAAGLSRPAAKP